MIRKVCDYIKLNNMMEKGDSLVVGVSGGADSVCLLFVLSELRKEYEVKLTAVHINHGIRGKEADLDEQFVKELCSRLDIDYHNYYYNVKEIAAQESLSEEEAGRNVRYRAFSEVCRLIGGNKIAIAHNTNDNAETVLFHLFRGTGIKGLTGIDPIRKLNMADGEITVIRPLLCVSRQEIEDFLRQYAIPYQIDSTNLTEDYSRNKIRNRVLTYVTKEINQNAVSHISEAAAQLKEIEEFVTKSIMDRYHILVDETEPFFCVTVEELRKEDIVIQRGIIRRILEKLAGNLKDLEAKHVEQVLSLYKKQVGRQISLPYDIIVKREYNEMKFYCSNNPKVGDSILHEKVESREIMIPGKLYLPENRMFLETEVFNYKKNEPIPKNSCAKWFDYDKIENAVLIRNRKEGDYIQINCLGGRKRLKDYFIDQKIPREERNNRLLIADGNHIMWILGDGERISEKYKVEETTNRVLLIKLIDAEENESGR